MKVNSFIGGTHGHLLGWPDMLDLYATTSSFLKTGYFYSSFRSTANLRKRYREFPRIPCAAHTHSLPYYSHSPPDDTFFMSDEPPWTHRQHPKSIVDIRVHSWCCTFHGFGQCIHHYGVIQRSLTVRNSLSSIHSSIPPSPLTTGHFSVSIVFPFPGCHRIGFIEYLAFSGWLFPITIIFYMKKNVTKFTCWK